jgi:serine/threonine protein kinase
MNVNDTPELEPLIETCTQCGAAMDVSTAMPIEDLLCPVCGEENRVRKQVQQYLIESVIGGGGMGKVYRAFDLNLDRSVALKVIRQELGSDAEHLKKFEEEARLTALVNHPNVVKVFSFGSDHGLLFIAMELVEKGNLSNLIDMQGRIAELQALEIGIQIAEGLNAACQSGLLHRDIKPGNILFMDTRTVKIVDFGLAQFLEQEAADASSEIWGTSYYIPPERLNRQPEDVRSDIYSLGSTLFHAIAGRPPYEAENASLVALKHIRSKPVSLQTFAPDVSSSTAQVINRMLQKDPNDRYQSYEELIEHLTYARNALMGRPSSGRGRQEHLSLEDGESQKAMMWITVSVLALALLIGLGIFAFRGKIFQEDDASARREKQIVTVEKNYEKARELLLKNDYAGSRNAFAELCKNENLPQPLGRWSCFHFGLAALLDGKNGDAIRIFAQIYNQGMYSSSPSDNTLANFFVETGRVISEKKPVSRSAIKFYNPRNCEALALLLFGLHDWQLGQDEEALAFLEAFRKSSPASPYAWIGDYKPIAEKIIEKIKTRSRSPEHSL